MKANVPITMLILSLFATSNGTWSESPEAVLAHYGMNASESLINPGELKGDSDKLAFQAARLVHDVKSTGGQVLRWIPTDVWPQWRCSNDPEDWGGQIDPNWFKVAAALLQAGDRDGVKIVVTLSDLTNASFGGVGTGADATRKRLQFWADHRMAAEGKDSYSDHVCRVVAPYYGRRESEIFIDPVLRARFSRRLSTMAKYLSGFSALGGIELFNEPEFSLTHTPEYWKAVATMLRDVKEVSPSLSKTPVFSGTAAWDSKIIVEAQKVGALAMEPFLTVHSYNDYTRPETELNGDLNNLIDYLQRLAPGKPIIVAEAGSKVSLSQQEDNAKMIRILLRLYRTRHIGLWVWGDWFDAVHDTDYKWDFNPRSAAGRSLAPFFFDTSMLARYMRPQRVNVILRPSAKVGFVAMSAQKVDDPNPIKTGLWSLSLDGGRYLGFSRAGVFPRRADPPELFSAPPPSFFTSEGMRPSQWVAVSQDGNNWRLDVHRCVSAGSDGVETPAALLGLVEDTHRNDFGPCYRSLLISDASKL